jgi:hypothetical protein
MISGKTQAAYEWAQGWPGLERLKLNAIANENNDASLTPTATDLIKTKYIDGTAEREFVFQLRLITRWSDGNDDINLDAQEMADSWFDWVQTQDEVPGFADSHVEPAQNIPVLNAVFEDEQMAEYLFQATITYTE